MVETVKPQKWRRSAWCKEPKGSRFDGGTPAGRHGGGRQGTGRRELRTSRSLGKKVTPVLQRWGRVVSHSNRIQCYALQQGTE
ncbi:Protein of unknown function [Gryllus bimaculatus]|nr:Protein of unknown function [Gryllus bimaculatus]